MRKTIYPSDMSRERFEPIHPLDWPQPVWHTDLGTVATCLTAHAPNV
jgi:hypothetical protein